jgi:DNA-binding NarL/FixJ family response regulator
MPGLQVMLVDDSALLRELVRIVLEDGGNAVVAEARTGREAVAEAANHQPDVVLLDLSMPEMDGLEALPELRRVAPRTKVVVLTGFDNPALAAHALELGAARYIVKGATPGEILSAVEEAAAAA